MPAVNSSAAPKTSQVSVLDAMGWVPSWGMLAADDLEDNEALKFPQSYKSYSSMMNESQIQGLCHGSTWPIFRMRWFIDPGDARQDGVERLAQDLGLPIADEEIQPRRTKNRFKFLAHIEEALDSAFLGFKIFEQVAPVGDDGWVHLRKLLNVPALSVAEMNQEADGSVVWIKQHGIEMPELSIERLVWYAFQKRGSNWLGRSLLRGCYGPWMLKDRALRIGVMNLQRAGVGTPVIEAHPGASEADLIILNRFAERFSANQKSGGAVPAGAKLRLVGVEGSQPDSVAFAKLMNEEMARAFLQMFMQAGQTGTGSRSTTESWIDWHKLTLEYMADWFASIFNEHVIEDDWDWNYGEEEEAVPALRWEWDDKQEANAQAVEDPAAQLRSQIDQGKIDAPEDVAAMIGAEPGRDARGSTAWRRSAGRRQGGRGMRAAGVSPAAMPPLPLPSRALRRQLYDHEITAAVDYAALDTAYQSSLDLLVAEVRTLQGYQIEALHDAIIDADGDMATLSELDVEPEHRDVIVMRLRQVSDLAAQQAVEEARRQGVTLDRPNTDDLQAGLLNRAEAIDNILTRDLSTAAGRNAVRLSGGSLTASEVADQVRIDLNSRSDAYLRDLLGGGVQQAINDGRGFVIGRADPIRIYASELLDENTCTNCRQRDGTQYEDMTDAARDYPSGGYKNCLGRERCRGVLVAVYEETEAQA